MDLEIEQEFFTDLACTFHSRALGCWGAWPEPLMLGKRLLQARAKLNVGFCDLLDTGLFPSQSAVISFARHYLRHEFLRPITVTKWGVAPVGKEERLVGLIERRISALIGREPETLRDTAARALAASKVARRWRSIPGSKAAAAEGAATAGKEDGQGVVAWAAGEENRGVEVCVGVGAASVMPHYTAAGATGLDAASRLASNDPDMCIHVTKSGRL